LDWETSPALRSLARLCDQLPPEVRAKSGGDLEHLANERYRSERTGAAAQEAAVLRFLAARKGQPWSQYQLGKALAGGGLPLRTPDGRTQLHYEPWTCQALHWDAALRSGAVTAELVSDLNWHTRILAGERSPPAGLAGAWLLTAESREQEHPSDEDALRALRLRFERARKLGLARLTNDPDEDAAAARRLLLAHWPRPSSELGWTSPALEALAAEGLDQGWPTKPSRIGDLQGLRGREQAHAALALIQGGDPRGATVLADRLWEGNGVPREPRSAALLWAFAAERGDPRGFFGLARAFREEGGVLRDDLIEECSIMARRCSGDDSVLREAQALSKPLRPRLAWRDRQKALAGSWPKPPAD
jgi:TPR repeat protein